MTEPKPTLDLGALFRGDLDDMTVGELRERYARPTLDADGIAEPRVCSRVECGGLPPHPARDHIGPGVRT